MSDKDYRYRKSNRGKASQKKVTSNLQLDPISHIKNIKFKMQHNSKNNIASNNTDGSGSRAPSPRSPGGAGGGGTPRPPLPDEEVVIDEDKGIVMQRINGNEYIVCRDPQFPAPSISNGRLCWHTDRMDPTQSCLFLEGSGRSLSGGNDQKFACFGSRGVGHFLVRDPLNRTTADFATARNSGSGNISGVAGSMEGNSMLQADDDDDNDDDDGGELEPRAITRGVGGGHHVAQPLWVRSDTRTYVQTLQHLIVESELNCLNHSEVSEDDCLFNPNHLRVQEDRTKIDGSSEDPTRDFIIEGISHDTVLLCQLTLLPRLVDGDDLPDEPAECIVFTDPAGSQKILELPFNYRNYSVGEFIFATLGGAIYKGMEISRNTETYPAVEYRLPVAIKTIPNYKLKNGREPMKGNEDRMKEVAAMQYVDRRISELIHMHETSEPNRGRDNPQLDALLEGKEYLVKFRGAINDGRRLHIITEYYDAEELHMFWIRNKMGPRNIPRWFKVFRKIALGLFVLHRCGVCHRDISLENVLLRLDGSERPVLLDYGQALLLPRDPTTLEEKLCCTPFFRVGKTFYYPLESMASPAKRRPVDGLKYDSWQLGVLLGMMMGGEKCNFPFPRHEYNVGQLWHEFYHLVFAENYDLIFARMGMTQEQLQTYHRVFELFRMCVVTRGKRRYTKDLIDFMRKYISVAP